MIALIVASKSSFVKIMSEFSLIAEHPDPIERPTSAAKIAFWSLIPSPVTTTFLSHYFNPSVIIYLWAGLHLARTLSSFMIFLKVSRSPILSSSLIPTFSSKVSACITAYSLFSSSYVKIPALWATTLAFSIWSPLSILMFIVPFDLACLTALLTVDLNGSLRAKAPSRINGYFPLRISSLRAVDSDGDCCAKFLHLSSYISK